MLMPKRTKYRKMIGMCMSMSITQNLLRHSGQAKAINERRTTKCPNRPILDASQGHLFYLRIGAKHNPVSLHDHWRALLFCEED